MPKHLATKSSAVGFYTAGSTSVEAYFDVLRKSGAAVRRVLIYTAGGPLVLLLRPILTSEPGAIVERTSGRKLRFGQIAALPDLITDVPVITDADLKAAHCVQG